MNDDLTEGLRSLLATMGVGEGEMASAEREGRLHLLAVEHLLLPEGGRLTMGELADSSGLEHGFARELWRALGFPDPSDDERLFTEADVVAFKVARSLLDDGLGTHVVLQLARVMGSSTAKVAETQALTILERVDQGPGDLPEEVAHLFAVVYLANVVVPDTAHILALLHRRHLQHAVLRHLLDAPHGDEPPRAFVVGFADLVGFTVLSQELDQRELASVVDRFETLAYNTIGGLGGRVIKMIGDEVMFAVDDAAAGIEIGLALADAYASDDQLSDVRVGLAWGPALSREGDLYGPVVNLASRIVNIARPGSVVVAPEVVEQLGEGEERFALRPLRPRYLKNIGRVALVRAYRPSAGDRRGIRRLATDARQAGEAYIEG